MCLIDISPSLLPHSGPKPWAFSLLPLRRSDDRGGSFSYPHRGAESWDRPGRGDIPRRTVPQPAHGMWDGSCGWPTAAGDAHGAGNRGASGGWTGPEAQPWKQCSRGAPRGGGDATGMVVLGSGRRVSPACQWHRPALRGHGSRADSATTNATSCSRCLASCARCCWNRTYGTPDEDEHRLDGDLPSPSGGAGWGAGLPALGAAGDRPSARCCRQSTEGWPMRRGDSRRTRPLVRETGSTLLDPLPARTVRIRSSTSAHALNTLRAWPSAVSARAIPPY